VPLHLHLRKAGIRELWVTTRGSLRVYVVYCVWALMWPVERSALQSEKQNRVSLIRATTLSSKLGFPRSLDTAQIWVFSWLQNFLISWFQYQFRISQIDRVFRVGFLWIKATYVIWISPECLVFLSGAYMYLINGTTLGVSHAIGFWMHGNNINFLFSFP